MTPFNACVKATAETEKECLENGIKLVGEDEGYSDEALEIFNKHYNKLIKQND